MSDERERVVRELHEGAGCDWCDGYGYGRRCKHWRAMSKTYDAGAASERKAIVEWLRAEAGNQFSQAYTLAYLDAFTAIERGDHIKDNK